MHKGLDLNVNINIQNAFYNHKHYVHKKKQKNIRTVKEYIYILVN